jgi:hypothetical protein
LELFELFPKFGEKQKVDIKHLLQRAVKPATELLYHPLQLLQQAVKYFTANWSYLNRLLRPKAVGKVLLYRLPEPRKRVIKEETRTSFMQPHKKKYSFKIPQIP